MQKFDQVRRARLKTSLIRFFLILSFPWLVLCVVLHQCGRPLSPGFSGQQRLDHLELLAYMNRSKRSRDCKNVIPSYDVLLVSPGGTGSSSSFRWFRTTFGTSIKINTSVDLDGLKHLSFLNLLAKLHACHSHTRLIIYNFANPVDAIFSLTRRGFAQSQMQKLGSTCSYPKDALKNVTTYASLKRDILGFEEHIASFILGGLSMVGIPVVFLRSTTRNEPQVAAHLNAILQMYGVKTKGANFNSKMHSVQNFTYLSKYENHSSYHILENTYKGLLDLHIKLGFLAISNGTQLTRVL